MILAERISLVSRIIGFFGIIPFTTRDSVVYAEQRRRLGWLEQQGQWGLV